ncbi:MAG: hypothetical protein CFE26_15295 [Verrucomicrobiales bacterium VVV1]|nr:MAG: hypothetical protein CFE26_15295 [Verrucomicrobiales bacterium VVV1]
MTTIPPKRRVAIRGGVVLWLMAWTALALEPPAAEMLGRLGSENFKERLTAQASLLEWARKNPAEAKDWLFDRALNDGDPEVRRRYTAVLRELVIDVDYLQDGEGYVGIMMAPAPVMVPGDALARMGIRATLVVPGTAAAASGLVPGDVIVEAGDQSWRDLTAVDEFSKWIRQHKPGQKVTFKLLRNGKLEPIEVVLGRRPPDSGMFMFGELPDTAALAKEAELAKDAYFRNWFQKRIEAK